jgi:uncharacterized protein YndB with AHSA1/START domain
MTITHGSFSLERRYPASRERVFAAFADPAAKAKWFVGPDDGTTLEASMDFRVGGREVNAGRMPDGTTTRFDAQYYDIVPNDRIVYAYQMHLNDTRISVSLATIELHPDGAGTRLVLTEHGAFLDGFDDPKLREQGTNDLLDALGRSLATA